MSVVGKYGRSPKCPSVVEEYLVELVVDTCSKSPCGTPFELTNKGKANVAKTSVAAVWETVPRSGHVLSKPVSTWSNSVYDDPEKSGPRNGA